MKCRILVVFIVLFLIISCGPKKQIQIPEKKISNLEKGNYLWEIGDKKGACENYKIVFANPQTPVELKIFSVKRLIMCSIDANDFILTKKLFDKWQLIDPSYDLKWDYHKLYCQYLLTKGDIEEFYSYIKQHIETTASYIVKKNLFVLSQEISIKNKELDRARKLFSDYFGLFNDQEKKEILFELLKNINQNIEMVKNYPLSCLDVTILPDKLIAWNNVLISLQQGVLSWIQGYGILKKIVSEDFYLSDLLKEEFKKLEKKYKVPKVELALLLPLMPPYEKMSYGILRGVEAGIWELEELGIEVSVKVFNTGSKNWKKRFLEYAKKGMIVGGPMRDMVWSEILEDDLPEKFHFFVFRSHIPLEGEKGFRFFPSRVDQTRALVKYFKENFDICSYAIFYPKGEYGRTLGEAFFNEVKSIGCEIKAISWYSPNNTKSWQKKVEEFLGVPEDIFKEKDEEKIKEFEPQLDFQAVFIPDSFQNARIIIPSFFYYKANKLYFLGSTLWEGEKKDLTSLEYSIFKNSYFPSPWVRDKDNMQQNQLERDLYILSKRDVDFWSCLGYDFFRYAYNLSSNRDKNGEINLNISDFQWTMAPLHWDEKGMAQQDMYVINVTKMH